MSREEFNKWRNKLILLVVGSIISISIAGIATNVYSSSKAVDRSLRNEVAVKELRDGKADKGDDNGIHQTLLEGQLRNANDIKEMRSTNENQFQFLIEQIQEVNKNILDLHIK